MAAESAAVKRSSVPDSSASQKSLGAFSGSLKAFSALMNEATDLLLLSVAAAAKSKKYFDIYQAIGRMTLQVVGTTAFG